MISLRPTVHVVQKRSKTQKGFTLIEMMAVLVLFGLLTAVVVPNFERWFSNTERRVSASELAVRLQKLYARAALLGQNFELNAATASEKLADGQAALVLPAGWSFAEGQSLSIRASGLCQETSIRFASAAQILVLDVKADDCEIAIRSNTAPLQ